LAALWQLGQLRNVAQSNVAQSDLPETPTLVLFYTPATPKAPSEIGRLRSAFTYGHLQ
jgi:hypothetical protein